MHVDVRRPFRRRHNNIYILQPSRLMFARIFLLIHDNVVFVMLIPIRSIDFPPHTTLKTKTMKGKENKELPNRNQFELIYGTVGRYSHRFCRF